MFKRRVVESEIPETDSLAVASAVEVPMPAPERPVVAPEVPRPQPAMHTGPVSCIGSGMAIVGNIECNGPAQIYGRVEGEVRASDLLIGDGAQVDGSVVAQEVTVCGRVKGTIRAVRVKLQGGGSVEGDIFHRSLSIDENSVFEGSSRRVENPTDATVTVDTKAPPKKSVQTAPLPLASTLSSTEAS